MIFIDINNLVGKPLPRSDIIIFLKNSLSQLKVKNAELSLAFVDEKTSQKINQSYRGLNRSTDVLSFSFDPSSKSLDGEIIVCYEIALRQAKEMGHSLKWEIMRLLVHGLLHLVGYNHQKEKESLAMEKIENNLLANGKFN